MRSGAAIRDVERRRRHRPAATMRQRAKLAQLAARLSVPTPRVISRREASAEITRLQALTAQPVLDGFDTAVLGADCSPQACETSVGTAPVSVEQGGSGAA